MTIPLTTGSYMHRPVLRRWGRRMCAIVFAFAILQSSVSASELAPASTPAPEVFALRVDPTPIPSVPPKEIAAATDYNQANLTRAIVSMYKVPPSRAAQIVSNVKDVSAARKVDPLLLLAIVGVESSFNPKAVSNAGAVGLTQAIPRWHPEKVRALEKRGLGVFDVRGNLDMGAQILSEYSRRHRGNRVLTLQQYNGNMKDKTRRYAGKVLSLYEKFRRHN